MAEKVGKGILFVLSAPSGTGKTSLEKMAAKIIPGLKRSISHTTRPEREGENDGDCYHFTDEATFKKMVEEKRFIEWAQVHGNLYGTSYSAVEQAEKNREDILLVIDTQGAAKLKESEVNGVYVFLLPPSMKELEKRLNSRGTEDASETKKRLIIAAKEISHCNMYDYIIVNDELDNAMENFWAIIRAERCKRSRSDGQFPDYSLPPME